MKASLLILGAAIACSGVAQSNRTVGRIVVERGEAKLERETTKAVALVRKFAAIEEGHRITLSSGGLATVVLLSSGHRFRISGGSIHVMRSAKLVHVSGPKPQTLRAIPQGSARILRSKDPSRQAGVLVRGEDLRVTPNGSVRGGNVKLQWPSQSAGQIQIVLIDAMGKRRVEKLDGTSTSFDLPELAPGLSIAYTIGFLSDDELVTVIEGSVRRLSKHELTALETAEAELNAAELSRVEGILLRGEVYAKFGLYDEALEQLEGLAREMEELDAGLTERIAQIRAAQAGLASPAGSTSARS